MGHRPVEPPLTFGADPNKAADPGFFFLTWVFFHIFINFSGNDAWFMSVHNYYHLRSKNVGPMSDLSND